MSPVKDSVRKAILARSPLVYLESPEEGRVLSILRELHAEGAAAALFCEWSCVSGLAGLEAVAADSRDPVAALRQVLAAGRPGFFIFKDLDPFLVRPEVLRALRDVYYGGFSEAGATLFIVGPSATIPEGLKKELALISVPLPSADELLAEIASFRQGHPEVVWSDPLAKEASLGLKGLTLSESRHLLHRLFESRLADSKTVMDEIFAEKEMIVRKSGYLEFCPPRWDISGMGGMGALKDWLGNRKALFSQEALDKGIPIPKGLLMMGISGCGKSLAVKVISSLWNIPLFRLDMSLVFSGLYGTPESAFHNALTTIEAVAPAVLWIDEIENALGMDESGNTISSQIFSSFLTWMQEKPPLVFIAATANKINALPAEILRKGRFDEVFFVDLPDEGERREILEIHLRRNGADPAGFDLKTLSALTKDWNGAEIEQAVVAARVIAYAENRKMETRDLALAANRIVPLSTTMETQIKFIRSWAFSRATPASRNARAGRRA